MVDVDRMKFWLDVGPAAFYCLMLCLGFYIVQPVGLEAVAYGIAGVTWVVATAASLFVVRHRVTDSAVPEEYPAGMRQFLSISWLPIQVLLLVPLFSGPRWQLIIVLIGTFLAVVGVVALLLVTYNWITFSADTTPSPSHDGS